MDQHPSRPHFFESWIFEALTEELPEDSEDASGIDLVLDRLFRDGAQPLLPSDLPGARCATRCDVGELSSLLEGDGRG